MKYKVHPQNLPERFALWAGMVPMPMVDSLFPLVKTRALMSGLRLGVFEALRDSALAPSDLAEKLSLDAESLELLLRVLAASDYVSMEKPARGSAQPRFALTALARKTLLKGAPMECRGYVEFNYVQWESLERLDELLKTGRGLDFHRNMHDTSAWESYQRGMLEIARLHAPLLAKRVPVRPGATKLLDPAGSHGLLGAAICRRHPGLKATVLELPEALEIARGLAREAAIEDVVTHAQGNILTDAFPRADVVMLGNILHHFSPEQNRDILARAFACLEKGGTVAIWDIERRGRGKKPELGGDASALFFRLTSTSRCYAAKDYHGWLAGAGFTAVRVEKPMVTPLHFLIHARKS